MAVIAPALDRLRAELNKRWPGRDRRTDGWIGDRAHAVTGSPENGGSDHNVNRRGIVDAFDIDVDGIDCRLVVAAATKHPSVNYVIWNRRIWSRSRGFASRAYTGSNPHTDHIHVSLLQTTAAENSTRNWGIASGTVTTPTTSTSTSTWPASLAGQLPIIEAAAGERGSVRKLQALLNAVGPPNASGASLDVDGVFGEKTATAVRAFQKAAKLTVDGVVGPKTWTALLGGLPTVEQGSDGGPVIKLQHLLNVHGAKVTTDGDFGPQTGAAVRSVQSRYGLDADGVAGPKTWTVLLTR